MKLFLQLVHAAASFSDTGLATAIDAASAGRSYDVVWHADKDRASARNGWIAQHPTQDLSARFDESGAEIRARVASEWRWKLQVAGIARSDALQELDHARLSVSRDVVDLDRGQLAERYLHREAGLEHTLTLAARPAGQGDLRVRLAIDTDLAQALDSDARGASYRDDCGLEVLAYRGLTAWDANGRELGARIEAHANGLELVVNDARAAYPLLIDPVISTSEAKLVSSTPANYAVLGRILALDGDVAAVHVRTGQFTNGVAIFEHGAGGWAQTAVLQTPCANIDLDGDWLLAGDGYFGWTGDCYLWRRSGSVWIYSDALGNPSPNYTCEPQTFGISLDLDVPLAAVGETERTCPWAGGSVYIGEVNAQGNWRIQHRIAGAAIQGFGTRVALDGDDLLIGGAYRVMHYRRDPVTGDFSFVRDVVSNTGGLGLTQVALDDGVAVVRHLGGLEIYEQLGSQWSLVATAVTDSTVTPPQSPCGSFGQSLSVVDGLIAIADAISDAQGANSGSVQLWSRNGGWVRNGTVLASDASALDCFGVSVDLERGPSAGSARLIAGMPFEDSAGTTDSGAAYVFELEHQGAQIYCTSKLNSFACVPRVAFSGTPSATSPNAFDVRCINVLNQRNGVFFYGTSGRAITPFQGGFRCVASPTRRTGTLSSGGSPATTSDCSGVLALDFNAWIQSGVDPSLVVGTIVDGQFSSRDGGASFGTNLSEAIELTVGP